MDAAESDFDIKLQKISGDLIADFDRSLPTFLRKQDGRGSASVRSWVRMRETARLTNILDSFQELPQLLDPHLPRWIPFLSEAYLEYLQARNRSKKRVSSRSKWLIPGGQAICKILYTFCKVRGEKVIVRFLNVESKYLELLLSGIEEAEAADDSTSGSKWSWEQRYLVLLWLSHLMLAPFDLATISSVDLADESVPEIRGLKLSGNLPGMTLRVIPLGIKYLATSGKERDAAKMLLVRIAMRRDMQKLGVLESLVHWALSSFQGHQDESSEMTYYYIGRLSLLSGILRASSDTSDMNSYLSSIFNTVHGVSTGENELSKTVVSLALARKTIIKVLRSVIVLLLRQQRQGMTNTELAETAIGYLLECLNDNDTPVRLAASKSLSIITLKLDPDMAHQVVEAVLESLNRNVLWSKASKASGGKPIRDLSAADNLEWHGLMLTLSHLLYRRSPPAEQLSDIIHALLLGLSFEQRSTSGGSVGANVRDAACFGIWALARRYSTRELLAVPTQSVFAAKAHPEASSILQVLGIELVVTGSLDPAGNIRRGASAALQELIGRHPDTVERGIAVVQTVDYHDVARRSRAIEEVALNVTKLSRQYGEAIIDGILGWRGIGDLNAPSRRASGNAFGTLTAELARYDPEKGPSRFISFIELVIDRLDALEKRQVEERHGLLLCLAAAIDNFPEFCCKDKASDRSISLNILQTGSRILEDCSSSVYRRPDLVAEGASRLVVSLLPVLQAAYTQHISPPEFVRGEQLLSSSRSLILSRLASSVHAVESNSAELDRFVSALQALVPSWLSRNEEEILDSASLAALLLLVCLGREKRLKVFKDWAETARHKPASRSSAHGQGYFYTLALADALIEGAPQGSSSEFSRLALHDRWKDDTTIEARVSILQSLTRSRLLQQKPLGFLDLLAEGLDDYTTNAQGDVGSHVRVQALRAVKSLWIRRVGEDKPWAEESVRKLFCGVLRLAAEKLDRVRPEAQEALSLTMDGRYAETFKNLTFSSKNYFKTLLNFIHVDDCLDPAVYRAVKSDSKAWMAQLLAGFVTSADTGNEDLVIASRAALCEFCGASPENLNTVCTALWRNLKDYQGEDRVIVPTLEVVAYLFHAGLYQQSTEVDLRSLCLQTQKAGYKTGNVRKITACVKVYGGVAGSVMGAGAGAQEARGRLAALMFHPWPRVRSAVVDEIWGLVDDGEGAADGLLGVDWGEAEKGQVQELAAKILA